MDQLLFCFVLLLVGLFTLSSGFFNGGGIVSTVITTRAMEPMPALFLVALCQVGGIFLLGHAVIQMIGQRMIVFSPAASADEKIAVLAAALIGALCWNGLMWSLSLPSSSNHSLLGGLLGAAYTLASATVVWPVVVKVLLGLVFIPFAAALLSFGLAKLLFQAGQNLTPAAGPALRRMHVMVLIGVALANGSNDGQKSLALVLLAMLAMGGPVAAPAQLPVWVGLVCGGLLGLGTLLGSRRCIQTVGKGLYRLTSWQGLCAQIAAMLLVGGSSMAGFPMATSHVMSSSIVGAGTAVRPAGVRWSLAGSIGLAWLLTIPASATVAALFSYVVSKAF